MEIRKYEVITFYWNESEQLQVNLFVKTKFLDGWEPVDFHISEDGNVVSANDGINHDCSNQIQKVYKPEKI